MRLQIASVLFAAALGGCFATTDVGYSGGYSAGYVAPAPTYTTTATVSVDNSYEPDLVDVGGGVQVIADYDEPVFYTDNFYWRFYGGSWQRSNVYSGGWTVYNDVPYSVRRIDRPHEYVRYRPSGYTPRARREPVRDHRQPTQNYGRDRREPYRPATGPAVRDHREPYRAPAAQPYRPAPDVRDHRTAPAPAAQPYRQAPAAQPYRPAPDVRDHRTAPAPAARPAPAQPTTRDHRSDDKRRRDHRD